MIKQWMVNIVGLYMNVKGLFSLTEIISYTDYFIILIAEQAATVTEISLSTLKSVTSQKH